MSTPLPPTQPPPTHTHTHCSAVLHKHSSVNKSQSHPCCVRGHILRFRCGFWFKKPVCCTATRSSSWLAGLFLFLFLPSVVSSFFSSSVQMILRLMQYGLFVSAFRKYICTFDKWRDLVFEKKKKSWYRPIKRYVMLHLFNFRFMFFPAVPLYAPWRQRPQSLN